MSILSAAAFLGAAAISSGVFAQATAPTAVTTGASSASAPASAKPTIAELLPINKAPFAFSDAPLADVVAALGKNYGLAVIDVPEVKDRITFRSPKDLSAQQAIDVFSAILQPMG